MHNISDYKGNEYEPTNRTRELYRNVLDAKDQIGEARLSLMNAINDLNRLRVVPGLEGIGHVLEGLKPMFYSAEQTIDQLYDEWECDPNTLADHHYFERIE